MPVAVRGRGFWVASSGFPAVAVLLPGQDLAAEPEPGAESLAVEHGARHVGVAALVDVDGGGSGQAQQGGYLVGIDEVVEIHAPAHVVSVGDADQVCRPTPSSGSLTC